MGVDMQAVANIIVANITFANITVAQLNVGCFIHFILYKLL